MIRIVEHFVLIVLVLVGGLLLDYRLRQVQKVSLDRGYEEGIDVGRHKLSEFLEYLVSEGVVTASRTNNGMIEIRPVIRQESPKRVIPRTVDFSSGLTAFQHDRR